PREVWDEDVRLMKQAGVDVVSIAIFSWAKLQPTADTWDFAWLDEIIDLMHENGIGVDLATATASPPPWLTIAHPEVLPVTAEGNVLSQGARQHWRPTSPVFREYALTLVAKLAERYGSHPGVVAWHVNNELGCHNAYDYSDDAANAFRAWLIERYETIDGLNFAWGTAFWSQRYGSFDEILPPRLAASFPNPTQQLDFLRFSSDALIDHLTAERDVLNRITPDIPVTTNFMVVGETRHLDYDKMAREIDFVSNDHYVVEGRDELAFSASLTSGFARHRPWFLMEHSTSAVNWQPINRPKRPGELIRDSLTHVAHGADAVCYFQWRQSAAGAEKFHSSMIPHGGEDTRVYRDVVKLGGILQSLGDVVGSDRARADVAIVFDWEAWRGAELDSHPSEKLNYRREALEWFTALTELGIRVDVVPSAMDLDGYRLVIAPVLYAVPASLRDKLTAFVEGGGHLVTTYFSGIADENDHIWLGGYPGAFREMLGIRVEEFRPLWEDETVVLSNGTTGSLWSEPIDIASDDVEVLLSYENEEELGAAVTRRPVGSGSAAYVSTRLGVAGLTHLLPALLEGAGVESELPAALRGKVELVTREGEGGRFEFYINRTDSFVDLPEGDYLYGATTLAPRGVAVRRA
ncbi:MAG TPA: beta-galactosidase, partial [Microbacterium sp.]|nr:beta-galactosidase [Microbacterium sp.]